MNTMHAFAGLSLDRPRLMGVINVTPDSFSDGGCFFDAAAAIDQGRRLHDQGADILDIGGESTRPGADAVTPDEELRRVLPVVEALATEGYMVSIDTRRAEVMRHAIDAGARIVNDVTALTGDPESAAVCAAADVDVVLMHMQGTPQTMQDDPTYSDAAADVIAYLGARIAAAHDAGIGEGRIAVDPGIGFGKTLDHNLRILNRLGDFADLGTPVLLGVSRKSFIARIDGDGPAEERVPGSVAAAVAGWMRGVRLFRVHDVAETRQALAVWRAIDEHGQSEEKDTGTR